MERFIANRREGDLLYLSSSEVRHLRALRITRGDLFEVYFEGRLFSATLLRLEGQQAVCALVEEIKKEILKPEIILYQCIPLELKLMEEVIDRCSQAGVQRLVPLFCKRGFRKSIEWQEKLERWRRLSLSSFKQCRRPKPMEIDSPAELREVSPQEEVCLALDNFGDGMNIKDVDLRRQSYGLLVGPEGGLSAEEVSFLRSRGFLPLLLKPYIYRSEMAGAVAAALIMNLAHR